MKKKPDELTLNEWAALLDEYKATPNFRSGAAMRIENTPFTSARYSGGMTYNGDSYTYFEPVVDGHAPNEDGSPYVAWLMVRDDFLKWVTAKLKKAATPDRQKCRWFDRCMECCRRKPGVVKTQTSILFVEPSCKPSETCGWEAITPETPALDADMEDAL